MTQRVVVTGGTGSIGRRLVPALIGRGYQVEVITRRVREARGILGARQRLIAGDCRCPGPWQEALDGADAVVHLAGAGVADRRWTKAYRELIALSRIESTFQVVEAIAAATRRPMVLVSASASGYYGDTGEESADERFPAGAGFLADVCVRWEEEARKAEALGVRTVRARIGMVLDEHGPALAAMLPWFRLALGATIGDGRQWTPWIHWRDCAEALARCVERTSLTGAVNIVAPESCRQRDLAKALGRTVGRPVFLRAPRWGLRLLKGGLAEELFLSQRVTPKALRADGFPFRAETIEECFALLAAEDEAQEPRAS